MSSERAFRFTHALCRQPGRSIAQGLRAVDQGDPNPEQFAHQHSAYVAALIQAGVEPTVLDSLEAFPDSVFIEDAAVIVDGVAILMRPGAQTRAGEVAALSPDLQRHCRRTMALPGTGTVDGGDVLLTDTQAFVGLSDRTSPSGVDALAEVLADFGYKTQAVSVPQDVLHFKSDCGLLDSQTIFSTQRLAVSGCFEDYNVIYAPQGEEAAANLIRVNDHVLLSAGFSRSEELLSEHEYAVITLDTSEAARVDGGLSCLSLRYTQ